MSAQHYQCPVCDCDIDVQKQMAKQRIWSDGIASVIKYEGDNNTFVWKHPLEDFNIGSQLIVHESQEAIFFRDGQALDLFPPGRYTLEVQSIPLVSSLYDSPLEPKGVFHSEVYFVNLTTQMGIRWGTDSKVRLLDPDTGVPIEIGASGEFNLRVTDSRKVVGKLVGTESGLGRESILSTGSASFNGTSGHFRSLVMTRVKAFLARIIKENKINTLEIDQHLDALSDALRIRINEGLAEYGLTMPEFFVTTIVTPDDDPNFKRLKQQHAEKYLRIRDEEIRKAEAEAAFERKTVEARADAQMKIIGAQGNAEVTKLTAQAEAEAYRMQAEAEALEMKMKGYTYQQETSRQVGLEAVKGGIAGGSGNGGGSGLGDVVGLGVTLGAIGGVIGLTKDAISPIADASSGLGQTFGNIVSQPNGSISGQSANTGWDCECGARSNTGNFCSNCGGKKPEAPQTWDCGCGEKGITGNFCPRCGGKKPEAPQTWDCGCGQKGMTGNFCPNCGRKREDAQNGGGDNEQE
jgi:membrane protease subunit (stomatin/prohibitin family)